MELKDFDYELPKERIAQVPAMPRDSARLLYLPIHSGPCQHQVFTDIISHLKAGDLLVFNKTRVIPARLLGRKAGTGGQVECFLLHQQSPDTWSCLVRPGRRLQPGTKLEFGDGQLIGYITERTEGGGRNVRFEWEGNFQDVLNQVGVIPLPPYIHQPLIDPERYQTIYGNRPGSVAAPTAGLHFTSAVLEALQQKGIEFAEVILHVGLGTFRPVETDQIENHVMHKEYYEISEDTAKAINRAKAEGRRIIAVGTTSVRTLESMSENGQLKAGKGWTDIFIYPGYQFQIIDGLLTNFHLPKSTLLMLVSALAGRERILAAYKEAVDRQYRFFSFGDAMLIL
jgi:S-adenosylmethionine:tRNA ribosyltransferase-isomerase